jgi:hypothetical protein
VVVALTQKAARTRVLHGENGGESLQEVAIVRAMSAPVPLLSAPRSPVKTSLSKPADVGWADLAVVAFVQSDRTGEVADALAIDVPSP